jgi:hypothetical protein
MHPSTWRPPTRILGVAAAAAIGLSALSALPGLAPLAAAKDHHDPQPSCALGADGSIQHVIYLQFDNTHFRRDNPNVPSDLEQMPHLLNFLQDNGTLMANDHTVLISHTGTGILSSLTGNYPDRTGQPVANSFRYFTPSGSTRTGVTFAYWTAPLFDPAPGATDTTPEMINENGKIAPAPWVPYTRAGCDVGSVASANTILENTAIDIPTVFGAASPEAAEVAADGGAAGTQSFADFVGIGVHCAQGSSLCTDANGAKADKLPDEPGGYSGYKGLFGAKYVNPVIKPSGPMKDLDGNVIEDANGHKGFPGFDGMEATVSLSYVAQMQEAGVPITYAYISDAHDDHGTAGNVHVAYGPGEAGYEQQLHDYDMAFKQFFDRLASDGINKSNTLFVVTVDEGDHFVGDPPTPANCDGVNTPCAYNRVGEINADLRRMVFSQFGDTTTFSIHSDDAPTVYVNGTAAQPLRDRSDPAVRTLEQEMAGLDGDNPYTGHTENNIMVALADKVELNTLHMITSDPFRNETFTAFADPDWFFFATGATSCSNPPACITIPPRNSSSGSFAWNHGDIQEEIGNTWVGLVGPGVAHGGVDRSTWTDHTNVRPTMMALLGLHDDYTTDGRVLVEALTTKATPHALTAHRETVQRLGEVYEQINAPFGALAHDTLRASTRALASTNSNTYDSIEGSIKDLTNRRDTLATHIRDALFAAAFDGQALNEQQAKAWIDQANALLAEAHGLA